MKGTNPIPGWTLITGGGSGLGRAFALEAARQGARLMVSDINPETARVTASMASAAGAKATASCRCDVTQIDEVRELAARLTGQPIDLILHSAGVASGGLASDIPLNTWHWTIDTNLMGSVHMAMVFLPLLKQQHQGQLVFIASAASFLALPAAAPYNAAKAGVIALAETLDTEVIGTAVRVRAVCPAFFRSALINAGRFADPATRAAGARLASWGPSAEQVAHRTFRLLRGSATILVPAPEARLLAGFKRLMPRVYCWLVSAVWRRWFGGG